MLWAAISQTLTVFLILFYFVFKKSNRVLESELDLGPGVRVKNPGLLGPEVESESGVLNILSPESEWESLKKIRTLHP